MKKLTKVLLGLLFLFFTLMTPFTKANRAIRGIAILLQPREVAHPFFYSYEGKKLLRGLRINPQESIEKQKESFLQALEPNPEFSLEVLEFLNDLFFARNKNAFFHASRFRLERMEKEFSMLSQEPSLILSH